jgi:hypothetical protein
MFFFFVKRVKRDFRLVFNSYSLRSQQVYRGGSWEMLCGGWMFDQAGDEVDEQATQRIRPASLQVMHLRA